MPYAGCHSTKMNAAATIFSCKKKQKYGTKFPLQVVKETVHTIHQSALHKIKPDQEKPTAHGIK